MTNFKNFVVRKGLEVAESIKLNGKTVTSLIDSAGTTGLINNVIDAAPGALDTLNELAAALGDDANFSTTITNQIAGKLDSATTIALIDSSYVAARQTSGGNDSATTIALIDSSYVQVRQVTPVSSFNTISVDGQTDVVADTTAVSWPLATEQQRLRNTDWYASDAFGGHMDMAGNYAIVGATYYDESPYENNGAAFIFFRSGTTWTQQAKLTVTTSAHQYRMGAAVALNTDATVAIVTMNSSNISGASVTVFTRSGTTWTQGQTIASSGLVGSDPKWGTQGNISIRGNHFIVGANDDVASGSNATRWGSAWVYYKSGSTWGLQQELIPSDHAVTTDANFGHFISMPTDSIVAIGAPGYSSNGRVYIFERSGTTWTETAKITAPTSGSIDFGAGVSLDGDYLAVGAPRLTTNTGKVYIYKKVSGSWTLQANIQASDASTGKYFGQVTQLKGDTLLVGAYGANTVYVFTRSGSTWTEVRKVVGTTLNGSGSAPTGIGGQQSDGISFNSNTAFDDFIVGTANQGVYVVTSGVGAIYSDTLTLAAGTGITLTTNATTDTVTIAGSSAGLDSAGATALVDSAYVQARQTKYTNADFTDSAYVTTQINGVIAAAPGALDTLNELAAALGDDANFSTTITNQIAGKLDSAQTIALVDSAYVAARQAGPITQSATAPASPSSGDMWFDTTDASLFVYYADSDGAQWVDISGSTGAAGSNGTNGTNGTNGAAGATGATGATGAAGSGALTWGSTIITDSAINVGVNNGYFVDTTSNIVTATLPSTASVGDGITFVDYARKWNTNNFVIYSANGTNLQGEADSSVPYTTDGQSLQLIYSGDSEGWIPISDDAVVKDALSPNYDPVELEMLIVAGGGAGGSQVGGGGGGGGYRTSTQTTSIVGDTVTVTVGAGGATAQSYGRRGEPGSASSIAATGLTTISSAGGGAGGGHTGVVDGVNHRLGTTGGSGGGHGSKYAYTATAGNVPSTSPVQGYAGGLAAVSSTYNTGGGGGAGAVGQNAVNASSGGNGGVGVANSITGTSVYYAGGGGGTIQSNRSGTGHNPGGLGGGGNGDSYNSGSGTNGTNGGVNLGGGGGGARQTNPSFTGGSGVVILKVLTSSYSGISSGSPTVTTSGLYHILKFTSSGSYTV